jgi:hypothetical protein
VVAQKGLPLKQHMASRQRRHNRTITSPAAQLNNHFTGGTTEQSLHRRHNRTITSLATQQNNHFTALENPRFSSKSSATSE